MRLNTIIFTDNSASCDIFDFFTMLKNQSLMLLEAFRKLHSDIQIDAQEYYPEAISKQNVSEKMSSYNSNCFLCFWYGHGKNNTFQMDNEDIITSNENYYVFSNALIYTFSCLNGNELADVLIENKAKAFIGYAGPAHCPYGIDDVTCDIVMSFLSSFLLDGKNIRKAVDDLKASYDNAVYNDELEPFQRSKYQENRDNIVLKGDENITINDLLVA